jgi:thiol-disulfide isomerase/thioredoxin
VKYLLATFTALIFFACSSPNEPAKEIKPTPGSWTLSFDISDSTRHVIIPAQMEIDSAMLLTLVNGEEKIVLKNSSRTGDTIVTRIEPYLSALHYVINRPDSITGYWVDESRDNYKIPFTAKPTTGSLNETKMWASKTFDVTFSPDCEDCSYKAVGVFDADANKLTGTFLTESGDYRYLQGRVDGGDSRSDFHLSCFDGAHLFYFTGTIVNDSIQNGMFYSGKHHSEKWIAAYNEKAELRDPDSLTFLKDGATSLDFAVRNMKGDSVQFNNESYLNKVTVIQIMGTWCPNCSDETRFWSDVRNQFGENLQIIPVAFERGEAFEKHVAAISNYKSQFQLPYEVYIGGSVSKSTAAQVFHSLNAISSYPTSIIIDKKGKVRKIHTGFYGPSTGKYHSLYTERLRLFVQQLLQEA